MNEAAKRSIVMACSRDRVASDAFTCGSAASPQNDQFWSDFGIDARGRDQLISAQLSSAQLSSAQLSSAQLSSAQH
jgi:hypothetical protein